MKIEFSYKKSSFRRREYAMPMRNVKMRLLSARANVNLENMISSSN